MCVQACEVGEGKSVRDKVQDLINIFLDKKSPVIRLENNHA